MALTQQEIQRQLSDMYNTGQGISKGIRELQIGEGNVNAQSLLGSDLARSAGQSTPSQKFGNIIMNMLIKAQQSIRPNIESLQKSQSGLQVEQAKRLAYTSPDLIGASPEMQSSARGASVSALEPSITGTGNRITSLTQQLGMMTDVLSQARALGQFMQTEEENELARQDDKRKEKLDLMLKAPAAFRTYFSALDPKKQKAELDSMGVGIEFINALPEDIEEKWVDVTLPDGSLAQQNTKTGQKNILVKAEKAGTAGTAIDTEEKIKARQDALNGVNLVNTILDDPNLDLVSGLSRFTPKAAFSPETQYVKNQIKQLKKTLSLENRAKLKGQGSVSDFEGKMLEEAATSLSRSLAYPDLLKELKKIKGAFSTYSGLPVNVRITSPSGETIETTITRDEIDALISEGNKIEYI